MPVRFIRRLRGTGFTNVADRLRFYLGASDAIVAFGLFSFIFGTKLHLREYFGAEFGLELAPQILGREFWERFDLWLAAFGLYALLGIITFGWYFLYKRAVRNEVDIFVSICSTFNAPHNWDNVIGRPWFPVFAIGITFAFLALTWFIDHIELYCLILLMFNVLDIRGNTVVRKNLVRFFAQPQYLPTDADLHRPFIMRRRVVAEDYWINRPHLKRIELAVVANVTALLIPLSQQIIDVSIWPEVSYAVLVLNITTQEIIVGGWRWRRDHRLAEIDDDQAVADRARVGEPAAQPAYSTIGLIRARLPLEHTFHHARP